MASVLQGLMARICKTPTAKRSNLRYSLLQESLLSLLEETICLSRSKKNSSRRLIDSHERSFSSCCTLHGVLSNERLSKGWSQQASVPQRRHVQWRIFLRRLAVVRAVIPRARYALMTSCTVARARHECLCG